MIDFDGMAKDWDSDPTKIERALAVAEAIRKMIPLSPTMSSLEYGCGTGLLSFALQSFVGQITLVDTSRGMLSVLEKKIRSSALTNMRSLHFDLLTGPQPRERYDLIYTLMTLHHIPDPSNLVMTFYLLLRNPGFLCIADLDAEDGSFHGMDSSVHRGFDRNALSETLLSIGFSRVDLQTCYEMKKETQKGEKVFPIFLLAAQKL